MRMRPSILPTLAMTLLLAFGGVSPAQEGEKEPLFDIVRGNWTITSRNIEDEEWVTKSVEIYQNRTELTGRFQGPNQQGGLRGTIHGHHIEFSTKTKNVLTFRGEVDGNTMSGNYGLHGRHAPFKAVRTNLTPTH
jgi:hypothetical protein